MSWWKLRKNQGKLFLNQGKVREKSGNLTGLKKWEPWTGIFLSMILRLRNSKCRVMPSWIFLPSSSHFGLKISFVKEGRKWWCHYFSKENYRSVFVNSLKLMSDYDILIFDEIVLEFAVSIFHIDTLWQTKMLVLPTSRTKVYVYEKASTQKIMESLLNMAASKNLCIK